MRKVALVAAVALCLAFLPTAPAGSSQTPSRGSASVSSAHSPAAAALRQDMRKLWTDHVVWTRD